MAGPWKPNKQIAVLGESIRWIKKKVFSVSMRSTHRNLRPHWDFLSKNKYISWPTITLVSFLASIYQKWDSNKNGDSAANITCSSSSFLSASTCFCLWVFQEIIKVIRSHTSGCVLNYRERWEIRTLTNTYKADLIFHIKTLYIFRFSID